MSPNHNEIIVEAPPVEAEPPVGTGTGSNHSEIVISADGPAGSAGARHHKGVIGS
jgi:hypothetical protein